MKKLSTCVMHSCRQLFAMLASSDPKQRKRLKITTAVPVILAACGVPPDLHEMLVNGQDDEVEKEFTYRPKELELAFEKPWLLNANKYW